MPNKSTIRHIAACVLLPIAAAQAQIAVAQQECVHRVIGTAVPVNTGTPKVINPITGTVIAANFFNSDAISNPTDELVTICIGSQGSSATGVAKIVTDIGQDDNTLIKAYPEFIIGTKFGNLWETSFRYYNNDPLAEEKKWPVVSSNGFEFANLDYVAERIGLPAFTDNLPDIQITIDMDEENVIGSNRDVMLESWFYDTSTNFNNIGTNIATNRPVANTADSSITYRSLNNIVGVGHPHYPALNNTLLEMMVHIGALSPNDISSTNRHPGQHPLTEWPLSPNDTDNDCINDAVDADSTGGPDINGDGIDDNKVAPVVIGQHTYSIWYGTSYLAPIVIFSRETNSNCEFRMDLTTEGEIQLDWNEFLQFTLTEIEPMLEQANVPWVIGDKNPFPTMRSRVGVIGGVEFGIEPQTNAPTNNPYIATINKLDIKVDGKHLGLTTPDAGSLTTTNINYPTNNAIINDTRVSFHGTASDDDGNGLQRVQIAIENTNYKTDSSGNPVDRWLSFSTGTLGEYSETSAELSNTTDFSADWNLTTTIPTDGQYRLRALAIDDLGNQNYACCAGYWPSYVDFTIDTTAPTAVFTYPMSNNATVPASPILTGNIQDPEGSGGHRMALVLWSHNAGSFVALDGTPLQSWSPADATITKFSTPRASWALPTSLPAGRYTATAYPFDKAGNFSADNRISRSFSVYSPDLIAPTATITSPRQNRSTVGSHPVIEGTVNDSGGSGVKQVLAVFWSHTASSFVTVNNDPIADWIPVAANLPVGNPDSGAWSLSTNLPIGHYTVTIYPVDAAGNYAQTNRASREFFITD